MTQYNDLGVHRAWALITDLAVLVTGAQLAERHGLSERTVYRYIRYLRDRGVRIAAQNGVGFILLSDRFCCPNCGATAELSRMRLSSLTGSARRGTVGYSAQETAA